MSPRRVSLVPVSDRTKSVLPTLEKTPALQQFIFQESSLKGLKFCSPRYHCGKVLCPYCSTRRATAERLRLAPTAHAYDEVLVLRLSVATNHNLTEAWDNLQATKSKFTSSRWLAKRAGGWYIQTELTHSSSGWNVHAQFLIFDADPERLRSLRAEAFDRWMASAASVGVTAHRSAQFAAIQDNPRKAVAYAVKGLMFQKADDDRRASDGRSPGDLLALYVAGDADAAAAWFELEALFSGRRRRFKESGGFLRGAKAND